MATRWIAQLIISIAVITVLVGFLFSYFAHAKKAAVDVRKKTELAHVLTLLETYYISEGYAPENPRGREWCEIDKLYGKKKCLREIGRDGYGSLPMSIDEHPYLYHEDNKKVLVATQLSKELPTEGRCIYSEDPFMWCASFKK